MLPAMLCFASAGIRGVVVDAATGLPLHGANVIIKRTSLGCATAADGSFQIAGIPEGRVLLMVSFLGYYTWEKTLELKADEVKELRVELLAGVIETSEVVITATKTESRIIDIPTRVSVIRPAQIDQTAMITLDDLMKNVAGVDVNRSFGLLSNKASVTLRGLGGKEQSRTLVLLNGIPLNKTDGGSVNWNMFNTDLVERIEISKGPGSSIYGGNAMGGVINVITRQPDKPLMARVSLRGGNFGTFGANLWLAGKIVCKKNKDRSFFWDIAGFGNISRGYYSEPSDSIIQADSTIARVYMKEISGALNVGYNFSRFASLTLGGEYYNDMRGSGVKVYEKNGGYTGHETWRANMNFCYAKNILDIKATFFFQDEYYRAVNESYKDLTYKLYDVFSNRRDFGMLVHLSQKPGKHQVISQGADFRQGSVNASDIYYTSTDKVNNAGKMNFYGAYIQDEISFHHNHFKIVAALRFDYARFFRGVFDVEDPTATTVFVQNYQNRNLPSEGWAALSPKLAFQYSFLKYYRTYLSYARGFRPSILDDMCRSGKIRGGFKIANPDLRPETLDNFEWGMDMAFFGKLFIDVSVFYSLGHDFMYYVSTGDSVDMGYTPLSPVFIRKNVSEARIYGAEAEVNCQILSGLNVYANYAYNVSEIVKYDAGNSPADLTGKYFTDVPRHLVSAGISYKNRIVNASLSYQYNGKMYINDLNSKDEVIGSDQYPGYNTVDLKVWKSFLKYFTLSVTVQNLFNEIHFDTKNQMSQGRFIFGELTFKF